MVSADIDNDNDGRYRTKCRLTELGVVKMDTNHSRTNRQFAFHSPFLHTVLTQGQRQQSQFRRECPTELTRFRTPVF